MAVFSGKRLLCSLLVDPNGTSKYMTMGLHPELFPGPELDLYEDIDKHVQSFGVLPKLGTLDLEVPDELEPPAYYYDDVVKRYKHRQIVRAMKDVQEDLTDKNPDEAIARMQECLVEIMRTGAQHKVVDFATDGSALLDQEWLALNKGHLLPGIFTGYQTLDQMMNGMRPGDVLSIIGRPGQGKTYKLLKMAHHAWDVQHKRVLFVTMEMKPLLLVQRVTAMHEHMSITMLKKGDIMKAKHQKIMSNMTELEGSHEKFWIVEGQSEIEDVVLLARQLQPDAIYIDGAYLLRTRDRRLSRWERINNVIEVIKQEIATDMGIPAFLTYQFNRMGAESKELENIGGSDAIGQISSCVLALFESEDDSVESLVKKKVNIMKGRSGEKGEFWINWVFDVPPFMDFSEIATAPSAQEFVYV